MISWHSAHCFQAIWIAIVHLIYIALCNLLLPLANIIRSTNSCRFKCTKILHINFYSDKINCKIDKFRCELTSPMIDMATLFVVVILLSWFLFTHSVDTSKVQQICDAWQLTSLRQLQFSNSSNWIQVTNRHSHSRSAQISSLWPFFSFIYHYYGFSVEKVTVQFDWHF